MKYNSDLLDFWKKCLPARLVLMKLHLHAMKISPPLAGRRVLLSSPVDTVNEINDRVFENLTTTIVTISYLSFLSAADVPFINLALFRLLATAVLAAAKTLESTDDTSEDLTRIRGSWSDSDSD